MRTSQQSLYMCLTYFSSVTADWVLIQSVYKPQEKPATMLLCAIKIADLHFHLGNHQTIKNKKNSRTFTSHPSVGLYRPTKLNTLVSGSCLKFPFSRTSEIIPHGTGLQPQALLTFFIFFTRRGANIVDYFVTFCGFHAATAENGGFSPIPLRWVLLTTICHNSPTAAGLRVGVAGAHFSTAVSMQLYCTITATTSSTSDCNISFFCPQALLSFWLCDSDGLCCIKCVFFHRKVNCSLSSICMCKFSQNLTLRSYQQPCSNYNKD